MPQNATFPSGECEAASKPLWPAGSRSAARGEVFFLFFFSFRAYGSRGPFPLGMIKSPGCPGTEPLRNATGVNRGSREGISRRSGPGLGNPGLCPIPALWIRLRAPLAWPGSWDHNLWFFFFKRGNRTGEGWGGETEKQYFSFSCRRPPIIPTSIF